MGFSISWIAFEGIDKNEALRRAALRDLARVDEANESPFSAAELPLGWSLIFSNDFDWGAPEHIRQLSSGLRVISCQVEEHVMFSSASCAVDGEESWSVWHDAQRDLLHLAELGTLPSQYEVIKDQLLAQQDAAVDASFAVDYVWDIPVTLAYEVTGYRHDLWDFPWCPRPRFTVVEPIT